MFLMLVSTRINLNKHLMFLYFFPAVRVFENIRLKNDSWDLVKKCRYRSNLCAPGLFSR